VLPIELNTDHLNLKEHHCENNHN
ncbi:hypothetical protein LCGC14_2132840, partial [marine sediment metagenome]